MKLRIISWNVRGINEGNKQGDKILDLFVLDRSCLS